MNYDLAMMALDGMARAPMSLRVEGGDVVIEAEAASFKELARLCLLLGGTQSDREEFELAPGVHLTRESPKLKLRVSPV